MTLLRVRVRARTEVGKTDQDIATVFGPLALGIVGAGSIVRNVHLPRFAEIPGAQVVAVANQHPERAKDVAGEFGIGTVYGRWQEVVDDSRV